MAGRIQINYDKALTDFAYAESQRRAFKKRSETLQKSLTDATKRLTLAEKNLKLANDDMARKFDIYLADQSNATKQSNWKRAEEKAKSLTNEKNQAARNVSILKSESSAVGTVITKLTDITAQTSTVLLNKKERASAAGVVNPTSNAGRLQDYIYNAPAAKSAYFTSNGIQTRLTTHGKHLPSSITDALKETFTGKDANRGVIQMYNQTARFLKSKLNSKGTLDTNSYGFRFHYNPTSVVLQYGAMDRNSPELMREDMTNFNPVTPLNVGGISFELYLNRIEDLSFLQKDGSITIKNSQTGSLRSALPSGDLYPETVSAGELAKIYKKGTMYDLEYFFRSIHGGMNDVDSDFRGRKTADIGWIARVPVEVHLGDGLRYLVSINNINVNHILFNERMVPTLSVVSVQGSRFFDAIAPKGKKS